jgi:uncharacterized membrane protein|tara:strand:- start:637 stop:876 length:240 start_codon:yes stop_codon:yes gene_type:complete
MNIIQGLARDVWEKKKTQNSAAGVLHDLSGIPVAVAWDMINRKVVLHEAVVYERDENEARLNAVHSNAYNREIAARWGE